MLALSSSVFALCAAPVTSVAQDGAEEIEEIVVSGLRGRPRSAVDSAVPIDTFDASAIEAVAHTDTVDILQTLVPSYNVGREPVSDGATFIRPAELRGLPSHHTLVLINGKRRHRASLVSIGGSGTQGPDVATIPSTAIQSIEVLRDGASSQYGSDAIAGVLNFNLKNNSEGITLVADTGQFFEGDGSMYTIQGNVGLPLGSNGFLSLSGEFNETDFSERAEAYCEGWFCVDPSNDRFAGSNVVSRAFVLGDPSLIGPGSVADSGYVLTAEDVAYLTPQILAYPDGTLNPHNASVAGENVMPWGQPNSDSARFFYNAGIELGGGDMELYSFGNYSESSGDGGFFHRYPFNGTIELLRNADGTLYSPMEKFTGGFTPRFEGEITDMGTAVGLRSTTDGGFAWDVSARYGSNEIDYRLFNTVNPSYGAASPTDFKPGTLENVEMQFQVDLSNEFDVGWESPMVLAYGLSYMDEEYNIGEATDVASYDDGPYSLADPFGFCDAAGNPTAVAGTGEYDMWNGVQAVAGNTIAGLNCGGPDPAFNIVGVGANGFPGYSPAFSDDYTRDSYAVYGDLSGDITERLFLQAAVRYEDYSDFGDETVGKIAGRYLLTDTFSFRASVGTGFRAPTPGQQGTTNVSTRLPNGIPVATGLFPASGPVAQALGASPLKPETSTSYTFGITAEIENLSLTMDFYRIDIDDRFNSISTRDVSTDPTAGEAYDNYLLLANAGVVGAESIGGVFYFTNAFDSETTGLDIVASYPVEWDNGQTTDLQLAYNWNRSRLASDASDFLNEEEQFDFERTDPNIRWNLTANHSIGDVSIMGRVRYFGASANSDRNTSVLPALFVQYFDPTTYFDLEANWQINDNWRVAVGGRNLFDEYPDKIDRVASDNDNCCGRTYVSGSIVPWQGGYYYGRVNVSF
jgi:iron complex outermembrane receptor protein